MCCCIRHSTKVVAEVSGPFLRVGVNRERFELDQRFGVVEPNWLRGSRLFPEVGVNRSGDCLALWSDCDGVHDARWIP